MAPETRDETVGDEDSQALLNAEQWSGGDFVELYASRSLRPVETILIDRYRPALSGRVLELGCGAGRLTGHLIEVARAVEGIDLSPAMIAYCRQTYPRATFRVGDLQDLSAFDSAWPSSPRTASRVAFDSIAPGGCWGLHARTT